MASPSAELGTVEQQWLCLAANLGQWEGSLANYDRSGGELERVATILFVYVDNPDDARKAREGAAPYKLSFTLRRCAAQRDGTQVFFSGMDMRVYGRALDPRGSMCSGPTFAPKLGRFVVEQNLNVRDDGARAAGSPIRARVRVVVFYNDEAQFQSITLFRETPRATDSQENFLLPSLPPHPSHVSEELVVCDAPGFEDAQESAESVLGDLYGDWTGTCTKVGPRPDSCASDLPSARSIRAGDRPGEGVIIQDSAAHDKAPASGVSDGAEKGRCVFLQTPEGPEQLVFLGGRVYVRLPVTLRSSFAMEFGWLYRPGQCTRVRREYTDRTWIHSSFITEHKI